MVECWQVYNCGAVNSCRLRQKILRKGFLVQSIFVMQVQLIAKIWWKSAFWLKKFGGNRHFGG